MSTDQILPDENGRNGMAVQPRRRISPSEYLELERAAETRSEYYDGEMFAMSGASRKHGLIVMNLAAALVPPLRGRCEVLGSEMRVKVQPTGLYTYPDVAVVCGRAELEDEHFDTLLNPTLLIEVLSPSTEKYDRGRKAEHYRRLDTLREYLLIAQDEPQVERYRRQGEHDWLLTEFNGLDQTLELTSIGFDLKLCDIYVGVLPR
jgi:Uma2 family endonuclease